MIHAHSIVGFPIARNFERDDDVFTLEVDRGEIVIVPGTSTLRTDEDAVLIDYSADTTITTSATIRTTPYTPVKYTSLTPDIATIDETGEITTLQGGRASFLVKGLAARRAYMMLTYESAGTATALRNWVDGSMAYEMQSKVDGLVDGLTPSDSTLNIFRPNDHASMTFVRNPDCWLADYHDKLTGICANVAGGWDGTNCMTAITLQHFVGARHYNNWTGIGLPRKVSFVDEDNVIHEITLRHKMQIGGSDIMLYRSDEPLPANIKPLKVLPPNMGRYIRNPKYGIPVGFRNQSGEVRIGEAINDTLEYIRHPKEILAGWYLRPSEGDSGSPSFAVIGDDLALCTTWTSSMLGPNYTEVDWASEIAAIDDMAGEDTELLPEVVDLTGFINYD